MPILVGDSGAVAWANGVNASVTALFAADAGLVSKGSVVRNVKDYGAVGNGSTDDTTAINAAIASIPLGGIVFFPQGIYQVASLITVPDGVILVGVNKYATSIRTTSATANVIQLGVISGLYRLSITSSVTRTAGISVDMRGNGCTVSECTMTNYFIGISVGVGGSNVTGARIVQSDLWSPSVQAGSGGIQLLQFSSAIIDGVTIVGSGGTQPSFGLLVRSGDTVNVSNVNITGHGRALQLEPATPNSCTAPAFTNCLFDSAGTVVGGSTVDSAQIWPSGYLYDVRFNNCWFGLSASQSGCFVYPQGAGVVDGLQFTGCTFNHNGHSGLRVIGAGVKNWAVIGGISAGNTNYGVSVSGASVNFRIEGAKIGSGLANGGSGAGINLDASANNRYIIMGNDITGNTTAIVDNTTGSPSRLVTNNLLV